MPACLELVFDLPELGPHPLCDRDAPQREPPAPGLPADVREAQEVKRLRLSGSVRSAVRGGEPPELDQASLAGMQLQGELREPAAKIVEELLGVTLMLEPDHEVVGPAHDDHVTACVASPPLPGPLVQDIVEVHVGEQRRGRSSLRCPFRCLRPASVLDDSCGQPLTDQPQDLLVRYPMLEKLHQPGLIELGEKVADVRIEYPVHLLPCDSGC